MFSIFEVVCFNYFQTVNRSAKILLRREIAKASFAFLSLNRTLPSAKLPAFRKAKASFAFLSLNRNFVAMDKRFYVTLFLFLSVVGQCLVFSQSSVLRQPEVSQALNAIYYLDDSEYAKALGIIKEKSLSAYIREYKSLMTYAIANNQDNYKAYMAASNAAIKAIDGFKYEEACLSNLLLHRSLVEMSDGNMLAGGVQFLKSYKAFKNAEKKYPSYEGQLMLRGIFNILLSQIPEKWKPLAGFLGFDDGDLEKGFADINQYRRNMTDVKGAYEESLLLSFSNIFLSHEQKLNDELEQCMRSSKSPMVNYLYVLSNGRRQRGEVAESVLNEVSQDMLDRFPLLIHQKAKFALRRLSPDECIRYADEFNAKYKGVACRNDVYLLKAYSYALKGMQDKQIEQATICAKMAAKSDVDHRTYDDAVRAQKPIDVVLLRSRLHFEYGNYEASKKTLDGYTPKSSDAIEYKFRLARCADIMKNYPEAMKVYKETITLAAKDKQYYGPYAAVYLADIHILRCEKSEASKWLKKAKEMNNGEHSKEIDQRIAVTMFKVEKMKD